MLRLTTNQLGMSGCHTNVFMEPVIQTKGPLVYLADNLGEEKKLGWCIDTEGKGFHEPLQSHSCKPEGADTQFKYCLLYTSPSPRDRG